MLKFRPPQHDPSSFTDADLDPVGGLVQSLRWFNSRAGLLSYSWAMHVTMATEKASSKSTQPLPVDVLWMLERYFLHGVLLELRALHDRDPKSLGIGQIAAGLADPDAREGLHEYLVKFPHGRMMADRVERDQYLDYVEKYAALMAAPVKVSTIKDHPLSAKTQLVRRMANKVVAHSTLDGFLLAGQDLTDVVMATMVVACAIDAAVGDAATTNELHVSESAGYRAAGLILHIEVDDRPLNTNMVRGFLSDWVTTGREWPLYPDGFEEWRAFDWQRNE